MPQRPPRPRCFRNGTFCLMARPPLLTRRESARTATCRFYLDAPGVGEYHSTHCFDTRGGFAMRHRFDRLFPVLIVLVLAASTSFAHHSVAGQFDTSKSLTLKGTISKVEWINPHIYVYLDVKDADGTVATWALDTLPTAMLRKAGLSKDTVMGQPGEVVTVVANPARDGT